MTRNNLSFLILDGFLKEYLQVPDLVFPALRES